MKKGITVGIIALFIISSVSPMVIGLESDAVESEVEREELLDNLAFYCNDDNGSNDKYECYKEKLPKDKSLVKAENLSKENTIDMNNDITSSVTKPSNIGLDLAIIDNVPYVWNQEDGLSGELHISPEIKNIGDVPVEGVMYYGNSSYRFNNKNYGSAWGGLLFGVLDPDESWIPQGGAGLWFVNYIPRIFTIEYEVFPMDSTPENNYIRQVWLVKGGGLFPFCMRIPFLE